MGFSNRASVPFTALGFYTDATTWDEWKDVSQLTGPLTLASQPNNISPAANMALAARMDAVNDFAELHQCFDIVMAKLRTAKPKYTMPLSFPHKNLQGLAHYPGIRRDHNPNLPTIPEAYPSSQKGHCSTGSGSTKMVVCSRFAKRCRDQGTIAHGPPIKR